MADGEIDILAIDRGTITAPAGCGKTHLIAEALSRHSGPKPILVLTHTNAGVVALRGRFDAAGVPSAAYRLSTLDGLAIRLLATFPLRGDYDHRILNLANPREDYPKIREAAWKLLKAGHIQDVLEASYDRMIVDEYQDCSIPQHALVYYASSALRICVLGDPMQAIFGWPGNELADWDKQVCVHFPPAGKLSTPWRWRNAGTEGFGQWLLEVRGKLVNGEAVDLNTAPAEVSWVHLDGTEDHARQLRAARTTAPTRDGTVLIIGKSTSPQSQRDFAGKTPGAITVESVDLRDLTDFAKDFDVRAPDALQKLVSFAAKVMINVGAADLLRRVNSLQCGMARKEPSAVEKRALFFCISPSNEAAVDLLVEIGREGGVRTHRPAVMRACIRALQQCDGSEGNTLLDAAARMREQNRLIGRPLPRRAVGSTLLLKGLEADVSVILDAGDLDARNLYVAMTRGSRLLVVCSDQAHLVR